MEQTMDKVMKDIVSQDNDKKMYCLTLLQKMLDGIDSDVSEMEPIYSEDDGAISWVRVYYKSGFDICINMECDSPMAMVRDIIHKAELR